MCRLAAFPPYFKRQQAIDILLEFEGNNTDGVGSAFVKNGQFIVDKHPHSLTDLLAKDANGFLSHMPYGGWTIAHLRAASHGGNSHRNTHPFVVGDRSQFTEEKLASGLGEWCVAHNGVWSDYGIVALAMSKVMTPKGETDSEVAAELINLVGPKKFSNEVDGGGVFLALRKTGELFAIKTSGSLECFHRKNKTVLLASTLDSRIYSKSYEHEKGWYHYSKNGKYIAHKHKESEDESGFGSWYGKFSRTHASPYSPVSQTSFKKSYIYPVEPRKITPFQPDLVRKEESRDVPEKVSLDYNKSFWQEALKEEYYD